MAPFVKKVMSEMQSEWCEREAADLSYKIINFSFWEVGSYWVWGRGVPWYNLSLKIPDCSVEWLGEEQE